MPEAVRLAVIALCLVFCAFGVYYRVQSLRTGERLDRTKEGWPILVGLRLAAVALLVATVLLLSRPSWFDAVAIELPVQVRWLGVAILAVAILWLLWMFHSLGRNLTDTVVTRRDATFVCHGPYRYVRNPMYTGVFTVGIGLGLAVGTWLIPLFSTTVFTLMAIRTKTEEKYLLERFGAEYRDYMARVPRFIPALKRPQSRKAAAR